MASDVSLWEDYKYIDRCQNHWEGVNYFCKNIYLIMVGMMELKR